MNNFVKWCLRTFFYIFKTRCKIEFNLKRLPTRGVYVSNHVSYLDPILLYAFLPGNPVFALNGHLYRRRWIRFFMHFADIMLFNPIEPGDIKELIAKVDSGRLVVIFAEGRITESGGLMKIYEAPGLVADKSKAPLIPIWIDGPQYGYFSKTKGKLPHRPLPKMRITVGKPRPFKLKDELRRQRDHISNEVYMILREMCFTDDELGKCTVRKGDLLVCEGGDIGRAAIWPYDEEICIQNHLHRLRAYAPVCVRFFYYIFYLYKQSGRIAGKGTAIQGLSAKVLSNLPIPLPPLAEQGRIVSKLGELLPLCAPRG